ncbi:thiol reductant ABC exporter subunit CydD [Nocardioides sp. Bht2]|uniref:thiol reductant ABC exporter subunit CydD n=1 Tax=Nocardioides sp. Bht2 TaxID=3392297 RepID=UPI0039B65BF3
MKPLDPRVLPHLKPARGALAAVVGGNVVAGVLVVAQAFTGAALVAELLAAPSQDGWHAAAFGFAAVTVLRAIVGFGVDSAAARAATTVGARLRQLVLRAVLDTPATELTSRRSGELATLATRGVTAVEPYLTRYLPTLVLAAVLPALTVLAIATQDIWSALIVIATLPLVPIFAILIGLSTKEQADKQWRALGTLAGHFLDVVRGLPTLVTHRRAQAQVPRIHAVTQRYRKANTETLKLAFASSAALELIATISVALVAVVVGLRLAAGGLDLQTALTVLLLAPEAYWPLRRVGAEFHSAAEGTATFEQIDTLLGPDAAAPAIDFEIRKPIEAEPVPIHIDNLTLSWPGRDEPVVRGLTATIPARGITAIVGPSGCGKSTLLQALLGELPVAGGGFDRGGLDDDQWQRSVAQVPQRPWIVPDTVATNLRIAVPHATDNDLWDVLAAVDLASLVAGLPARLETPLGEEGLGLSAGQRARLALARVLLADRPYVLLDEPTAHLDDETEQVMIEILKAISETRTVIVVAHRDSVVAAADQVIALNGPDAPDAVTPDRAPARLPEPLAATSPVPQSPEPDAPSRARWLWALLLGTLASASGVALTATAGWLIARSAEQPPVMMLTVAIVGVRTFGLARPALRYAERLLSHDVALRVLAERRSAVYAALIPLVPARLGRSSDVLTGIVDDVDAELDDRLRVRLPLVTWLGVAALALLTAFLILPAATLPIAAVSLGGGAIAWLAGRLGAQHYEPRFVAARGEIGRRSTELIDSARQLVLWQADRQALADVDAAGDRLSTASAGSARSTAAGRALALTVAGLGVVAVALLGAPALADGEVSGPLLALLLLLPLALADVTAPLADTGALSVRTRAARDRVDALFSTPPAVTDPATPRALPAGPGEVTLAGVSAEWIDGTPALAAVDLELTPGRWVGVTGPSGSGKSTLAMVLARFLLPVDGSARLNGTDYAELTGDDLRRVVGVVDDDPYLFASTVAENIRLAAPEADDLTVELAIRSVHLGPWLDALPQGLATRIGDGGRAVSGGERARLGLARAALAQHPVLVLDEPTAHLDTATAQAVARDILATRQGRSLVWITHDQVGLAAMDEILTLDADARQKVR